MSGIQASGWCRFDLDPMEPTFLGLCIFFSVSIPGIWASGLRHHLGLLLENSQAGNEIRTGI